MQGSHNIQLEVRATLKENGKETVIKLPNADSMIGFKVLDAAGEVKFEKEQPMKSWLFNFPKFIYEAMSEDSQTYYTTSGIATSTFPYYWNVDYVDSTNAYNGIQCGTDDGSILPLAYDNPGLGDRYEMGESAGEMGYRTTVINSSQEDADKFRVRIQRHISNYTGGSNTVKEVSLVGKGEDGKLISYIRDIDDDNDSPINVTIADYEALLVYYDLYISDASGFTKNIVRWFEALAKADYLVALKSTDNADINASANNTIYDLVNCNALVTDDSFGIVVGSGVGATGYDNYKLVSQTPNTTLTHSVTTFTAPSHLLGEQQFEISREFVNNTGYVTTVAETALYGKGTGTGNRTCLLWVNLGSVSVPATTTLEVTFIFRMII